MFSLSHHLVNVGTKGSVDEMISSGFEYFDLIEKYGEKNVEETMMYITNSTDPRGLAVLITPTVSRVTEILDAVHREFLVFYEENDD